MTWFGTFAATAALAAAFSALMAAAAAIQRKTGNSGWVDAVWTFSVGLLGAAAALTPLPGEGASHWGRQGLVAVMITLWAVRLGVHIVHRSLTRPDDPRYAKMQREWGEEAPRQMFALLQTQAFVSLPLPVAAMVAAHAPAGPLGLPDMIAAVIFATALAGEGIADRQLQRFAADPANRGRICEAGLWRYSRHPNYFFEWMHWLAYPVIALSSGLGYGPGWLALGAPLVMYWLLVHVSGIPPLEEHMLARHGDRYRAYQKSTNAFFPGPRRHV